MDVTSETSATLLTAPTSFGTCRTTSPRIVRPGGGRGGGNFPPGSGAVPFVAGGRGGGDQPGAPELAENMVLAQARAACVNPRNSPWVRSGGSDVYGDNIMAQLMDILRA